MSIALTAPRPFRTGFRTGPLRGAHPAGAPACTRPACARPAARRTRLLRRGPARAARPTLRLTRRGRLLLIGLPVLLGAVAVLAGVLLLVLSPQAQAGDAAPSGAQTRVVVVSPGDTLWSLAQEADPESDPRAAVERIVDLNDLQDSAVRPGQRLVVPQPETAAP